MKGTCNSLTEQQDRRDRQFSTSSQPSEVESSGRDRTAERAKALNAILARGDEILSASGANSRRSSIVSLDSRRNSRSATPELASALDGPTLRIGKTRPKQSVDPQKPSRLYQSRNSSASSLASMIISEPPQQPKVNVEKTLDARIHSIVNSLPSRVRLTKTVEETSGRKSRSPDGKRVPSASSSRTTTPTAPNLSDRASTRKQFSQPGDIKLYHLHRADGQTPIKLFVRLVGETGERVMVRVGGGWADLAEYLKEYATHHASQRKIVSERIEITDLPKSLRSSASNASLRRENERNLRSAASNASLRRGVTPGPGSRPTSPLPPPRGASTVNNKLTSSPIYDRNRKSLDPRTPPARGRPTSPQVTPPNINSRPVSRASFGGPSFRSSSRLSFVEYNESYNSSFEEASPRGTRTPTLTVTTPLGLAGPRAKNGEVSPERKAWVEGILGRVRVAHDGHVEMMKDPALTKSPTGSARGGDPSKSEKLEDMGKVGSTRRVFVKRN